MKNIEKKTEELTKDIVEGLEYELCDIEFRDEGDDGWVLTLYIYKEDGITIDDCEKVTRAIDSVIEEADYIPDSYILSVSSLGLDRPLKTMRDFERQIGKELDIHLYAPIEKQKQLIGFLRSLDEEKISMEVGDTIIEIPRKQIAKANLMLRF